MITEQDLQAAIAECQGVRNPDAKTCIMLAAFYTIKDHLFPGEPIGKSDSLREYSYATPPDPSPYSISLKSDTEFAKAIQGREPDEVMPIIDEAMSLVQVAYPRLYTAIMDKLG